LPFGLGEIGLYETRKRGKLRSVELRPEEPRYAYVFKAALEALGPSAELTQERMSIADLDQEWIRPQRWKA